MAEIIKKREFFDIIDFITEKFVLPIYFILIVFLNTGYVSIILGYDYIPLRIVNYIKMTTEILIGTSLMINFSPWRTLHITSSDAHIIFAAGSFLFCNVILEKLATSAFLKDHFGISIDHLIYHDKVKLGHFPV
jgi:hypothetical protein